MQPVTEDPIRALMRTKLGQASAIEHHERADSMHWVKGAKALTSRWSFVASLDDLAIVAAANPSIAELRAVFAALITCAPADAKTNGRADAALFAELLALAQAIATEVLAAVGARAGLDAVLTAFPGAEVVEGEPPEPEPDDGQPAEPEPDGPVPNHDSSVTTSVTDDGGWGPPLGTGLSIDDALDLLAAQAAQEAPEPPATAPAAPVPPAAPQEAVQAPTAPVIDIRPADCWRDIGVNVRALASPTEHIAAIRHLLAQSVLADVDPPGRWYEVLGVIRSGGTPDPDNPRIMRHPLGRVLSKAMTNGFHHPTYKCRRCSDVRWVTPEQPIVTETGEVVESTMPCPDCNTTAFKRWREGRFLPDGHAGRPVDTDERQPA